MYFLSTKYLKYGFNQIINWNHENHRVFTGNGGNLESIMFSSFDIFKKWCNHLLFLEGALIKVDLIAETTSSIILNFHNQDRYFQLNYKYEQDKCYDAFEELKGKGCQKRIFSYN